MHHHLVIDTDTGLTLAKIQAACLQEAFAKAGTELGLEDLSAVTAIKVCRLPTAKELAKESPEGMLGDRYRNYLSHADDGTGCEIMLDGAPLKSFSEWLNS